MAAADELFKQIKSAKVQDFRTQFDQTEAPTFLQPGYCAFLTYCKLISLCVCVRLKFKLLIFD